MGSMTFDSALVESVKDLAVAGLAVAYSVTAFFACLSVVSTEAGSFCRKKYLDQISLSQRKIVFPRQS
jgi:hypothetical protein